MSSRRPSNQGNVGAQAPADMYTPMLTGAPLGNIGNVAKLQGYQGSLPPLDTFTVVLANASSGAQVYIIGDPTGGLANMVGGTVNQPTSCSWGGAAGVTPMQLSFGYAPVSLTGYNYQTSSDAAQFNQNFELVSSDIKGNLLRNPVAIANAQRNNQFNDLLLTIELATPVILNWNNALLVTVLAGETVNLVFTPYMAWNRF